MKIYNKVLDKKILIGITVLVLIIVLVSTISGFQKLSDTPEKIQVISTKQIIPPKLTIDEITKPHDWVFEIKGQTTDTKTPINVIFSNPQGFQFTEDQVTPFSNGTFTTILTTGGPLMTQAGNYTISVYQGNKDMLVVRNFEINPIQLDLLDMTSFKVIKDGKTFDVHYNLKSGTVTESIHNKDGNSLLLKINSTDYNTLIITMPRELVDSKMGFCPPNPNEKDQQFSVLINGEKVFVTEVNTTPENRTLHIPFTKAHPTIEIISLCLV